VNKVCIEIPAGLIDEGETADECVVRELQEETAYVGKVIMSDLPGGSPIIFNDPGSLSLRLSVIEGRY
jgi:8-oxo-dGTP pyrophosphatase MutT (NUDIX family)